MTLPVYSDDRRDFSQGDTVRSYDHDDPCVVLASWRDWLWLDPIGYRNAKCQKRTFSVLVCCRDERKEVTQTVVKLRER